MRHNNPGLLKAAADVILPRTCSACGEPVAAYGDYEGFCPLCSEFVNPLHHPFCDLCGAPFDAAGGGEGLVCPHCMKDKPAFDKAEALFLYGGSLRQAILNMKYHRDQAALRALASHLRPAIEERIRAWHIQNVTGVPSDRIRTMKRGYPPVEFLLKLAPVKPRGLLKSLIRRRGHAPPLWGKNVSERRAIVKNRFKVTKPGYISGKNILLVDDIMTTGATCDACARSLKAAGAESVYVLTLARDVF